MPPAAALSSLRSPRLLLASHGRARQRLLTARGAHCGPALRAASRASDSHRSPVVLQQQAQVQPQVAAEASQQQHHHHAHRLQQDDGSLQIIMLLSLSLTLLLLPWVSKHPEFLIAPVLLAFTPVVGNGVRPVLKEAAAGLLNALRLSLGLLTHHEQHLLHSNHHHHHQQQQQHHHGRHQQLHHHQAPAAAAHHHHQQQHHQQQPQPLGPSSPWPNPARMPTAWPPAGAWQQQQQQPAPGAGGAPAAPAAPAAAASVGGDELDGGDWSPRGPPDPHKSDPHSQQHLQQLLAADSQAEAALRPRPPAATTQPVQQQQAQQAGGASSGAGRASPGRRSLDGGDPAAAVAAGVAAFDAASHHGSHHASHHHQHQQRDPRVLSREAKQQLYHGGNGGAGSG